MRINKYWFLDEYMYPLRDNHIFTPATKEQYDGVTIIYFDSEFRPIVLCDNWVKSGRAWSIADFWKDLNTALKASRIKGYKRKCDSDFTPIYRFSCDPVNTIRWWCRKFTTKQLETIRDAMKWHYTRKQLMGEE